MRRRWIWMAVLGVAVLTLGPSPAPLAFDVTQGLVVLDRLSYPTVEMLANVVFFVPIGFVVAAAVPRWSRLAAWGACIAGSVTVELLQSMIPGRLTTAVDVLTNSTGAAIGVLLYATFAWLRSRPRGATG
jgi:glycopeptide antibiotics resistance protein